MNKVKEFLRWISIFIPVICILFVCMIILTNEYLGKEYIVEIQQYDPYDVLRGKYLSVSLDLSNQDDENIWLLEENVMIPSDYMKIVDDENDEYYSYSKSAFYYLLGNIIYEKDEAKKEFKKVVLREILSDIRKAYNQGGLESPLDDMLERINKDKLFRTLQKNRTLVREYYNELNDIFTFFKDDTYDYENLNDSGYVNFEEKFIKLFLELINSGYSMKYFSIGARDLYLIEHIDDIFGILEKNYDVMSKLKQQDIEKYYRKNLKSGIAYLEVKKNKDNTVVGKKLSLSKPNSDYIPVNISIYWDGFAIVRIVSDEYRFYVDERKATDYDWIIRENDAYALVKVYGKTVRVKDVYIKDKKNFVPINEYYYYE